MGEWTTAQVQDRLELAAGVMRQMPGVMPQGFFNAWPEYFHSFADQVGQETRMRRPKPGPRDEECAEPGHHPDHVHHATDCLRTFLGQVRTANHIAAK